MHTFLIFPFKHMLCVIKSALLRCFEQEFTTCFPGELGKMSNFCLAELLYLDH